MHPNPAFRSEDRALLETMIEEVGFGMVFGQVPDGPRVAHTPLLSSGGNTGSWAVQFHLSRANALARHLDGMNALIVVNGPDAYVSPRWYAEPGQVPTWNYVALELEGRVRKTHEEGLAALLEALGRRQEARVAGDGEAWVPESVPQDHWDRLIRGITGFEMEVLAWRPTLKLSQNKPAGDRERIAEGLETNGAKALAGLMRSLVK